MRANRTDEPAPPDGDEQREQDAPRQDCGAQRQDKGQRGAAAAHQRLASVGEGVFAANAGQAAVADIVERDAGPRDAGFARAAALTFITELPAQLADLREQLGAFALVEPA